MNNQPNSTQPRDARAPTPLSRAGAQLRRRAPARPCSSAARCTPGHRSRRPSCAASRAATGSAAAARGCAAARLLTRAAGPRSPRGHAVIAGEVSDRAASAIGDPQARSERHARLRAIARGGR